MSNTNYRDLIAWQRAMSLAELAYRATNAMPREEQYGLTSQMRRAAVSIPSNIAEGEGRRSVGQFLHLLGIAYGSLRELETQALLANRLGFISDDQNRELTDGCAEVGRLLNGLMKSLRSRATSS